MARILIIEDDESVLMVLRDTLKFFGHEIVSARDGEEGVRLFREEKSDIIITDFYLPRKTGLEVIRELRQDYPDLGIIVYTAYDPSILDEATEAGAQYAFEKPFHLSTIQNAINSLLER